MVGADPLSYEIVEPLMRSYSKSIFLMGKPGSGQHTKAANQILIANNMVGICESLTYADNKGLKL